MRLRNSTTARLMKVATVGEPAPKSGLPLRRVLTLAAVTGVILAALYLGYHLSARILAAHWRESLKTVSDDRAEMLVASAARLGRPGIPVLVEALASPRESVAKAGRLWLDRQMKSWENLANHEAQRSVVALAEALASQLDTLGPAGRLEAARITQRLLQWRLDAQVVDRGRFTWVCDQILCAADFKIADPAAPAEMILSVAAETQTPEVAPPARAPEDLLLPHGLEIPEVAQVAEPRARFGSQVQDAPEPNVVPLPGVGTDPPANDLADAWAMRGHRLGEPSPLRPLARLYPSTGERVLVPASPENQSPAAEEEANLGGLTLSECMQRLHAPGIEALAAETELKRRGFDALRLSIARRVYDPNAKVRLQLVRDLPSIPGIGATEWLIKMAGDADEEVRLAAISLLATVNDPSVLDRVEAMARQDTSQRIRSQASRLKQRRQTFDR